MPDRRAAFLDRDGTILEDPGYLHDAGRVRLVPGAADGVRRLNEAGFLVITVSNQSGIARGLYPESAYFAVQDRLGTLLAASRAHLDGSYFCPHHPDVSGPCECRKPGLLLFQQAQAAFGIDFSRSYWVGDRLTDVEPGRQLGGHSFLVETGHGAEHRAQAKVLRVPAVADLAAAVDTIVNGG